MNIGSSHLPRVALIAGPTASGKSALAMALAKSRNGVVINADSAQVYADLRVLSARPTPREESEVPHRLYGYRDGATACSAADWAADARKTIDKLHEEERLPVLVGGTGLYLRTLLEGIAPIPEIDPNIRAEVRILPVDQAFAALTKEDGEAAARLRPTDKTRIARALEVVRSSGRSLAQWQQRREGGIADRISLSPLVLLPPREWLHERCNRRFEAMMDDEGIEEVRTLIARELSPSLPVMRAIGIAEISAMLDGHLTRDEAIESGQAATRQYAKRQYTWFRHQPPSEWQRFAGPVSEETDDALGELFPEL